MRFGRLAHDPVALASVPAHRFGTVPPPPALDRRSVDFEPGLFQNDTLPDCTAVALANVARATAALNGYQLAVDPSAVPAFYAACVGVPDTEAAMALTDGAVALDVLARQARDGFDVGPQRLYGQSAAIDVASRSDLASGIARFVGYWGITLRERDMQTVGGRWDVVPGRDDGPVVGGHMIMAWDYFGLADSDVLRVGTWGVLQQATWAFVHARIEEAYGVAWPQLVAAPLNTASPD